MTKHNRNEVRAIITPILRATEIEQLVRALVAERRWSQTAFVNLAPHLPLELVRLALDGANAHASSKGYAAFLFARLHARHKYDRKQRPGASDSRTDKVVKHRRIGLQTGRARDKELQGNWRSAFVRGGGLLSYGPDNVDIFRRSASYVDGILRGAKPADLPVQQPTKFELAVNLKTAKALGLTVPPLRCSPAPTR
jgi:hypothetical protein